jgi:hypothetical protein
MASDIVSSTAAYERWLDQQLEGGVIAADLAEKHDLMAKNPHRFLRATFWRWCERAPHLLAGLDASITGLAVGDIHVDNFGTWRDVEGRLVWGVNDFDEADAMPLVLDLVRLLVSIALFKKTPSATDGVAPLIAGYRQGLAAPTPIVLDEEFDALRRWVHVPDDQRAKFWSELAALRPAIPPAAVREVLAAAMPDPGISLTFAPRTAGGGSLGRPRWLAHGLWRGGHVVREAKALVPSGWQYAGHGAGAALRINEIACGPHRAPDPWYRLTTGTLLVRRRSPNNRKIDLDDLDDSLAFDIVLGLMGRDLAAIHAGSATAAAAMARATQGAAAERALAAAADRALAEVIADHSAWRAHHRGAA